MPPAGLSNESSEITHITFDGRDVAIFDSIRAPDSF